MSKFGNAVVFGQGQADPSKPLVVLLHGRGANAASIIGLADHLPSDANYVAVQAPIEEGGGFAWFQNRGIGRPVAESLAETMAWFNEWRTTNVAANQKVILVGFSGGGAFAGGLILNNSSDFAGAALLYATIPWDAGVSTEVGRLKDFPVFLAHGKADHIIPAELLEKTWTYLNGDSGAKITSHRGEEGHGLTGESLAQLNFWIETQIA